MSRAVHRSFFSFSGKGGLQVLVEKKRRPLLNPADPVDKRHNSPSGSRYLTLPLLNLSLCGAEQTVATGKKGKTRFPFQTLSPPHVRGLAACMLILPLTPL
ncbi:hypothetical protein CDAR_238951 [Caerostris darwini]|uniref:Uncharacterized protein n=1 Tax=Caerostris darwini TaxID=1538125 RepID=A0AAV4PXJ6_9ARAC|nr:hypothetical protein CDAR_238951 [Caerostris darwini]